MAKRTCVECGGELTGRQTKLCGKDCARERLKKSDAYKRAQVKYRDKNPKRGHAGHPTDCIECGARFTPTRWGQKHCTHQCYTDARRLPPGERQERRRSARSKRRALTKGASVEDIHTPDIYERDGWRCGICGDRVDPRLTYPNPMSVSLDHIVPISQGGEHSAANVQCSHLRCNISKGNRGTDQLRLVG